MPQAQNPILPGFYPDPSISQRNPILTHKHLAREYPVHNVGHADMVELKDGSWWRVALASRPRGGFYDGGNVKWSFGGYYRNSDVAIDLSPESLAIKWVSIRNEQRKNFEFLAESALALELEDFFEETFLGIRQTSWNFSYSVTVDLTELKSGDVFGLAAYIKEGGVMIAFIGKSEFKSKVKLSNFRS